MTFWWLTAGNLDKTSFSCTIQFPGPGRFITGLPVQCCVKTLRNKRFPDIKDRLRVTSDNLSNLIIGFISMEENVGMPDCRSIGFPAADKTIEVGTLVGGKLNVVLTLPREDYIGVNKI